MESIWKYNGGPSFLHFAVAFYFAFAFVATRFLLDRLIFRRLSIWFVSRGSSQLKLYKATRAKVLKCSESMWKLSYYVILEFCILSATYIEPWFKDVTQYFRGWPNQELNYLDVPMWVLHLQYCCSPYVGNTKEGFLCDDVSSCCHRCPDFWSYIIRFFRIGAVILSLHDASDIFLEAAKVFKCCGSELGASVLFGLFALSWLVLRLILFPFWVIRSSSYYSLEALNLSEASHIGMYYLFNTMLLTLLVFHIYWWKLICAMITR